MGLERSHFLWKNAIQVEKLIVEEMGYKIDKKEIYYKCEPTTIYFKKVQKHLQLFQLRTWSKLQVVLLFGKMDIVDGYIIENLLPI